MVGFTAVVTLCVVLLSPRPNAWLVMLLMFGGATAGTVAEVATCALQGDHRLGQAAISNSVVQLIAQGATFAVLIAGGGLVGVVAVTAAAALTSAAVLSGFFVRRFGWSWTWSVSAAYKAAHQGIPFLAWELGLLFYGSIDFVILPILTNAGMGGSYVFAYRLASIPGFFATIVVGAAFPTLASSRNDTDWFSAVLTRAAGLTFATTLPMAAGVAIMAPTLTRTLGGNHEFGDAIPLVAILSAHIPLAAIDTVLGAAVFARDRQRTLAVVAWVAAILNPIANLIAIPLADRLWSNGAIGAATVTVATELLMAVALWRMTRQWLRLGSLWETAWRAAAATTTLALSVPVLEHTQGPIVAVTASAALFALSAMALGLISPKDLIALQSALRRDQRSRDTLSTAGRPGDAKVTP